MKGYFLIAIFLVSSGIANAESLPLIIGEIDSVNSDSSMNLSDVEFAAPDIPELQSYKIKQFALNIDPDDLRMIVVGRRVKCRFHFHHRDIIYSDCTVFIGEDAHKITRIAVESNLGKRACSTAEASFEPTFRSIEFVKCPN